MKTLDDQLHGERKMLRWCLNVFEKIVVKHLHKSLKMHTSRRRRLRESICRKRPLFWQSDDWYLLHDNAQAHSPQLSSFLVRGTTPNGGADGWASRAAPKRNSARLLRMVREDTEASSEGVTCAWMAADESVGFTRAFPTMWRFSQRLCQERLEPGLRVNDISRIY
ncbi:uncharacterized protein TNCV_29511 [Trichonephila clavipes]|nr:uncharacterized protein TNCV_29511 [Trichonephila clavipes]